MMEGREGGKEGGKEGGRDVPLCGLAAHHALDDDAAGRAHHVGG